MWRFIVGLLATVGTLTLLGIGGCAAFLASAPFTTKPLPQNVVLSLDLRDVPSESTSSSLLGGDLFGGKRDIVDTVQLLWQAADDPRVVGMFVDIGDESAGLGRVQELRQAIAHFRGKGKFAIGFAESLGSGGTHFSDYYLASALEQIWLQPSGGFAVAGLAIETPFIKDGLDRLGVKVEGGKRYEYKSAPDTFLDTAYPPPARENLQQLLDSLYGQFVSDVARERNIEPAKVRQLIDSVPFDSEKARQERLVDRIGYRADALDEVTTRAGKSRTLVTLADYANDPSRPKPRGDTVALVRITGAIMSGSPNRGPLDDDNIATSEDIVDALDQAASAKEVKAIVLRIDSPGGTYPAADAIADAVGRARSAGKPVIVSMGDVAASGGYSPRCAPMSSWPSPRPSRPRSACSASGRWRPGSWPRSASTSSGCRSAPMPACIRCSSRRPRRSAPPSSASSTRSTPTSRARSARRASSRAAASTRRRAAVSSPASTPRRPA